MRAPKFEHLVGRTAWKCCDHDGTQVHPSTPTVVLTTREQIDGSKANRLDSDKYQTWIAARGGGAIVPCAPDSCFSDVVLVADPDGDLRVADGSGERTLALTPRPSTTRFQSEDPVYRNRIFDHPSSLEPDPFGRLWVLERPTQGPARIRLLAVDDLRILATVVPPIAPRDSSPLRFCASAPEQRPPAEGDPVRLVGLGTTEWGVVTARADPVSIWRQPYGAEWCEAVLEGVDRTGYEAVCVAGTCGSRAFVILRSRDSTRPNLLVVVDRCHIRPLDLSFLENPAAIVALSEEEVLIAEAEDSVGHRNLTVFWRFTIGDILSYKDQWGVRAFDGRALVVRADGTVLATTPNGMRRLFPRKVERVAHGRVETYGIDSELYGCVWHRLFLDVCLPAGTAISVSARMADELPTELLRRAPYARAVSPHELRADELLGSRTRDDEEGWEAVGLLDRRRARIDIPLSPEQRELPSHDEYRLARSVENPLEAIAFDTLEGLIKNRGGRYLWLRIELTGTGRRTPALAAIRATYPRPSLLTHLPSFWRADPRAAELMDRWLAQFEGLYTEIDQRIDALRHLVDPRVCPAETVEWLGAFVALTFDSRVREAVRRQLIEEASELFRKRGTVPGLERLLEILSESRVRIVEGFRLRRRSGAVLGGGGSATDFLMRSVLGPGLQLGTSDLSGDISRWQGWERELSERHDELLDRRADDEHPCPAAEPPLPLDLRPLVSFVRAFAHRFSVLVFCERNSELEAVVQQAVESNKPAHTLHELCWLNAGFRSGKNTYVGVGTALGDVRCLQPTLLGQAPLGVDRTLGRRSRSGVLGTFVGASTLGRNTHTG